MISRIFLLLISSSLFSQITYRDSLEYLHSIARDSFKNQIKQIENYPFQCEGDCHCELSQKARKSNLKIVEILLDSNYITFDYYTNEFVYPIFQELLKSNNLPSDKFHLLISKSDIPNAYSLTDGIIILNLGLLVRLETPDQLAFILAHEIAHQIRSHINLDLRIQCEYLNSEVFKYKLLMVKLSRFNKSKKLGEIVNEFGIDLMRHSRGHEIEADSLAIKLMKATMFNPNASLCLLDILNSADEAFYKNEIFYSKLFDSPNYPFKKEWLSKPKSIFIPVDSISEDFSTHPNCQKRKEHLMALFNLENCSANYPKEKLKTVQYTSEWLILENSLTSKDFSTAMYHALQMQLLDTNDLRLPKVVTYCLYEMYKFKVKDKLNEVVELPDYKRNNQFDQLLFFLNNLESDDFLKVGFNYTHNLNQKLNFSDVDLFNTEIAFSKALAMSNISIIRELYEQKFRSLPNENFNTPIFDFK